MISESKKFLFIHYPKTGGNSIQKALLEYSDDALVPTHFTRRSGYNEDFRTYNSNYKTHKHSTLNNYRQELEPELFKSLFKFTTVRNPWDRMISYYFSPHRQNSEWNREDFVEFVKKFPCSGCLQFRKVISGQYGNLITSDTDTEFPACLWMQRWIL